jgi:alkylation response protein AidB-like acyl-CoA dehydrogenase
MLAFRFDPVTLPEHAGELRREVREFLAETLGAVPARRRANSWQRFDADFSRRLGARGWIGMVWP